MKVLVVAFYVTAIAVLTLAIKGVYSKWMWLMFANVVLGHLAIGVYDWLSGGDYSDDNPDTSLQFGFCFWPSLILSITGSFVVGLVIATSLYVLLATILGFVFFFASTWAFCSSLMLVRHMRQKV